MSSFNEMIMSNSFLHFPDPAPSPLPLFPQELSEQKTKLIRAMNSFNEAIMLCDFSQPAWPIVFINEAWEQETGLNKGELTNTSFWQWFKVSKGAV